MTLIHVAVTGRDRRHLSELRNKFRVVVVGAQDTRRGVVVDAYIPAERIDWLREKGYGVQFLEEVETPGRTRQAEGRTAAEARLKRGRYGDVIWGGGYLTVDEVEAAIVLGEKNHPVVFERIPEVAHRGLRIDATAVAALHRADDGRRTEPTRIRRST